MSITEDKIVKIIDESVHTRGASVEQVGTQGALIVKDSTLQVEDSSTSGDAELLVKLQNHICEDNTTTTPLGAGEKFTGGWQDCLDYQEVNISVVADKDSAVNGLLIEWSADGVVVGDTDTFSVYANAGTNYTPNPAFRYVRVNYTNGAQAQTFFSLMTILRKTVTGGSFHRIDSTLKDDSDARLNITVPKLKTAANTYVSQTATTQGNAKVSIEELETGVSTNNKSQLKVTNYTADGSEGMQIIDGENNKLVAVTPIRELKVTETVRIVGTVFNGTEDTNFWTKTVTGSGAASFAGQASLTTGETADSTAKLVSVRKARFIPSSANQFRSIARFTTTGTANNLRRIGAYDANNGFFFELNGTTFSVGSRKATTDTLVNSGSFNGASTTYTLNTNVHRFNIDYTNLSAQFYIDDVLIHTISSATDPSVSNLTYPVTMENNNSGGSTSAVTFDIRVANIVRLGSLSSGGASKYQSGTTAGIVCKYGAGDLHGIAVSAVTQNSVITLYDNTAASGTILWSSGAMGAQTQPFSIDFFNIPFYTGLTLVIAAASSTVTLIYE